MQVFISWSKDRSRDVALALRELLRELIQDADVWMSDEDIYGGDLWALEIVKRLSEAEIGIICVTPENKSQPWLLFESGALVKELGASSAIPYLFQLEPTDLKGPLAQLNAVTADRKGTFRLAQTLNRALPRSFEQDQLKRMFDRWWPDLEAKLDAIPKPKKEKPGREPGDVQAETLSLVRALARDVRALKRDMGAAPTSASPKIDLRRTRLLGEIARIEHGIRSANTTYLEAIRDGDSEATEEALSEVGYLSTKLDELNRQLEGC